jgi:DNA (cytosine-5)-methyltransferase 1
MTHGSLFSGIGGFDLAAEWMGWENVFHCEWNEFGQRVLHHYWPQAIQYNDITQTDFTIHRLRIDVLTGGFPCQPYSAAGKRLGKEDERHLWPEMRRAIREIQPCWVVGENVRGLVNWNGGLVFDEVQSDLEAEGYEVLPFLVPACGKDAPHRRERIWFVAKNTLCVGRLHGKPKQEGAEVWEQRNTCARDTKRVHLSGRPTPHAESKRHESLNGNKPTELSAPTEKALHGRGGDWNDKPSTWSKFPTQSPICGGDDGLPTELDGITFSKWRNESIKAYGNAVVPQVVYEIFKSIEQYDRITTSTDVRAMV